MIETKLDYEIELRGFSKKTKEAYIYHIKNFIEYAKKEPRRITINDARKYILKLKKEGKTPATINLTIAAIKFLYKEIWKRHSFADLRSLKKETHVPLIISRQDIERMIKATHNTKHKLLIELLYSSGMRIGEAVRLRLKDIRIEEKLALIKHGKGAKDRYTILSDRFIRRFHEHLYERLQKGIISRYVFETKHSHITIRAGEEIIRNAGIKAGVSYNVFPHALRATFATHLYEQGNQEFSIQKLMGHSRTDTTRNYVNVANIKDIKSPMD